MGVTYQAPSAVTLICLMCLERKPVQSTGIVTYCGCVCGWRIIPAGGFTSETHCWDVEVRENPSQVNFICTALIKTTAP